MAGLSLEPTCPAPARPLSPVARVRRFLETPAVLLAAVGTVVVLVSLPLLRGLALRENERDAVRALRIFGGEVFAAESAPSRNLGALLEANEGLQRRLPDTRLVDDGRRLFHHGYLFELSLDDGGKPFLRAWPLAHGKTGLAAFLLGPDGELLGTPNASARWSGPEGAPSLADEPAWRALGEVDEAP